MSRPDDLLMAARTIRPRLSDLLGPDAGAVTRVLDNLLTQAAAGQPVDRRLQDVLARHEASRRWVRFFLQGNEQPAPGVARGYIAVPGDTIVPVPARRYACPVTGCPYVWYCRAVGQRLPVCPVHLERVALPLEPE